MLKIAQALSKNCQGISRRELLQVGGLGFLGLTLPDVLRGEQAQRSSPPARRRTEKSCILIFLHGGPSPMETFDPKPNAPDNIRGPFGPIATNVPGLQICELLPRMAQRMDRCALIRSLTGFNDRHENPTALTGMIRSRTAYGAVVTKLLGGIGNMPPYVHLGRKLNLGGGIDVGGGVFGPAFDPVVINDPLEGQVQLPQMSLSAEISPSRFQQRRELLAAIDQVRAQADSPALEQRDTFYQRAVDVLTSTQVRDAFDLSLEPDSARSKYGMTTFGQSLLMARRLVEAGTRFVQVAWSGIIGALSWDIHGDLGMISDMEDELCPRFDHGMAALLDDLHQRGLLDSTLIVCLGEMGRTPRINHVGGRDHWGASLFALLAGGGLPGGAVVGSTDAHCAYPASHPVYPQELAATIYRRLGIDTNADSRVHPFTENRQPIASLI